MARGLGSALGCFMLLGIVFTAVGTVSREREQNTLDSLLTLPIDRTDILRAKLVGSILSVRRLGWGLAAIWGLALFTGGLHPFAVPLLVLTFLAHVFFAASLGLWFSVVSPNKVQATLRAILTLFALMIVSFILGDRVACTTPMMSLWMLAFTLESKDWITSSDWYTPNFSKGEMEEQVMLALVGAIAYALIAVILWSRTCERFRGE
jgi:ABC-type transport system involved in multi-copper enzyme maturation permease subunit